MTTQSKLQNFIKNEGANASGLQNQGKTSQLKRRKKASCIDCQIKLFSEKTDRFSM